MEKVSVSELEEMIRSKFVEKGASEDEIKEEVIKSISEKIKNKSREEKESSEEVDNEEVVDVDISKPKDEEGKIPDAVTSSVEASEELEEVSKKEAELEAREQELAKKEEELNQREASLSVIELENEEKLFVFDENDISVGAEKLSTLEMNSVSNPEEKISMRNMWLKDAVKDVEIYVAKFEKIGNIEFDPFEGTATFTPDISDEKEEIDSEDVKLDMQGNMKDSIEPVTDVSQPIINESVELNPKSEQLAEDILASIVRIDDSMPYQDFSIAVARVLEDSYGSHNYAPFIKELEKQLSND